MRFSVSTSEPFKFQSNLPLFCLYLSSQALVEFLLLLRFAENDTKKTIPSGWFSRVEWESYHPARELILGKFSTSESMTSPGSSSKAFRIPVNLQVFFLESYARLILAEGKSSFYYKIGLVRTKTYNFLTISNILFSAARGFAITHLSQIK
jgi:hypothetical protein